MGVWGCLTLFEIVRELNLHASPRGCRLLQCVLKPLLFHGVRALRNG